MQRWNTRLLHSVLDAAHRSFVYTAWLSDASFVNEERSVSQGYGVSMKELFGNFFFSYLLTAVSVAVAVYVVAAPWLG